MMMILLAMNEYSSISVNPMKNSPILPKIEMIQLCWTPLLILIRCMRLCQECAAVGMAEGQMARLI